MKVSNNELNLNATPLPEVNITRNETALIRMAKGTSECIKRLTMGVAASTIILPLNYGMCSLMALTGLVKETDGNVIRMQILNDIVPKLIKNGWNKFSIEKLQNASCFFEEYVQQYNSHSPNRPITSLFPKVVGIVEIGLVSPIVEEIIFRGIMQDFLLTRVPKYVVKKIAPGKETVFDSTAAKVSRIVLTAAAFSALHLLNDGLFDDAYVQAQIAVTFMIGIGFGILKETRAGILGAISAHVTNNVIALVPSLLKC